MRNRFYSLWLCGLCIVVFVCQFVFSGFTDALVLNGLSWVEPWRFVSAIFLHGGIVHLLYNMLALFLFGLLLEHRIGSRLFLFTFFLTGIGANLIAVNFYSSSLGASGAIFGVIGALIILRPLEVVWAFGMPMPLFVAGIIWIGADIIGTFIPSNVGTIAHLSGVGIGILLGIFYRFMKPSNSLPKGNKISFSEDLMRDWEDAYLR